MGPPALNVAGEGGDNALAIILQAWPKKLIYLSLRYLAKFQRGCYALSQKSKEPTMALAGERGEWEMASQ
jgi:hypothetical protein